MRQHRSRLALRPLGESYQFAPFHACSKALRQHQFMRSSQPFGMRQHRFTPPSQTIRDHPHSLLRDSVISSLRGQTCHSSWHTHCSALHTSCRGLKPIGRLSVVPMCAPTYIVSICSFICLSIFGLIPRLALALQRYPK